MTRPEKIISMLYKGGKETHYGCNDRGLYIKLQSPLVDSDVYTFLNTEVEGFTKREVIRTRRARKLYHDLNDQSVG